MGALRLFRRNSAGEITLAIYHPATSSTWYWLVVLSRRDPFAWGWHGRAQIRTGQWHDYYRLPFGWTLIVSQQDFHRTKGGAA